MSNVRPWFRLSSIARPTSQGSSDPPPPQTPQTRPTPRRPVIVRPVVRQSSPPRQQQPPSPPRQQKLSPTLPRQQIPLPPPKATIPPPPTRSSYTPPPSPKEVQEALPRKPHSPPSPAHSARSSSSESSVKTRSVPSESETHHKAPLPRVVSPYSLPPSQLHTERETTQKNILTAEKTNQIHEPNHHNQNHRYQSNMTKKMHRQPSSDSENIMGTRVITIAGENKGAVMEILRSPQNKTGGTGTHSSRLLHGEKGRKLQSSSSNNSDEGEGKKKATKNSNNGNTNLPMKAFTNSNVQMINNSIVYNSTASHHDPGVHLRISRRPGSGNGFHVNEYGGGYTD